MLLRKYIFEAYPIPISEIQLDIVKRRTSIALSLFFMWAVVSTVWRVSVKEAVS
jgi:hypothetical protein